MSWYQPDLYFVLFLLTGFATILAIIYECIRRRPVYLKKAKPLDGLQRERPRKRPNGRFTPGEIARLEQDSRTRL
jgi:hypothetical protein